MEKYQFITYKGKRILYIDFSNCKSEEVIELFEKSKPVFKSQPPNSVLVLDNITNARFNTEVMKGLGEFMLHNKPYVRAAAIIGANDMAKVMLLGGERAAKRSLEVFDTELAAKDWLVSQG
jgi:hypothetical protein